MHHCTLQQKPIATIGEAAKIVGGSLEDLKNRCRSMPEYDVEVPVKPSESTVCIDEIDEVRKADQFKHHVYTRPRTSLGISQKEIKAMTGTCKLVYRNPDLDVKLEDRLSAKLLVAWGEFFLGQSIQKKPLIAKLMNRHDGKSSVWSTTFFRVVNVLLSEVPEEGLQELFSRTIKEGSQGLYLYTWKIKLSNYEANQLSQLIQKAYHISRKIKKEPSSETVKMEYAVIRDDLYGYIKDIIQYRRDTVHEEDTVVVEDSSSTVTQSSSEIASGYSEEQQKIAVNEKKAEEVDLSKIPLEVLLKEISQRFKSQGASAVDVALKF